MADLWEQVADHLASQNAATPPPPAQQAQGEQPGMVGQFFNQAMNQGIGPLSNALIRTASRTGLISPERAQQAIGTQLPVNPESLAAKAGGMVGGVAPALMGPLAPATMAISSAEQAREQVDARNAALIAQGQQPLTAGQQIANVGGQAALAYGMGKLMPGQAAGKALIGATPVLKNALLNAGKNIAVGAGIGAAEQNVFNVGSNLINKATNVDPDAMWNQGWQMATGQGAALGGVGQAIHEAPGVVKYLKDRAGNPVKPPPPVETPTPVPQENAPHANIPERPITPVEANPPVQEPRPAEGLKPETPVEANKAEGTSAVQPEPERAKTLPELPSEAGQWSHKQLKSWAEDNGFDTEGASGKLKLRNKITDQLLRQEKDLRRTEPLTGAPNKIKYDEDAAGIFKDADTKKEHTAIVETDIGGLKVMNTAYGHEGGDEMLKLAHQAMREELRVPEQRAGRAPDYLGSAAYRVGGDEFPMILRNVDSPEKVQAVMDRVNKNFDAKIAAKFPDMPEEARPFIAHNAEIRTPGDTRPIDQIRATADKGVEPVKSKIKATRNIPEGRTDFEQYLAERRAGMKPEETTWGKANAGKGAKPVETPAPQQPQEQGDFFARMKAKGAAAAELGKRLATEEEGGAPAEASKAYARRTLAPAIQKTVEGVKTTLGNISRAVGTGLTWTLRDRDAANNISKNLAEHAQHVAQLEEKLKPSRKIMEGWTDAQKDAWANQVEATGESTDPRVQDAADISRHENEQNIKDGKKYGLRTDKWEGDYLGRLAKFESVDASGTRSKLAGSENFLKGRTFNTYQEFADFVRAHGGEMAYDNPADTLLAKQAEIRRSITARKSMYEAEDQGHLQWVPDKEKAPEGFDTKLKDPLSQQDRPVIAPKWVVGKLAKMTHFEAQRYIEGPEWAKETRPIREGDPIPDGMTRTGQTQSGEYRANANVADQFNNLISPGLNKSSPVLRQISGLVKAGTSMALNLSGAHYVFDSYRSAAGAMGRAFEAAGQGKWDLAAKNAWLMNPVAALRYGAKGLAEYRAPGTHPELAPQVRGAVEGGARPAGPSVLNPDHFAKMQREWKAGNPIEATSQLMQGMVNVLHKPLFDHFVPKIKFAAAMMNSALAEGKTGLERTRKLSLASDVVDNSLGQVVRDRQFQNKLVTDVQDLLMTAPKFFEGDLRSLGSAGRDIVQSLRDLGSGKKVELTPAMYHAAAHLVLQTTLASLLQVAMTAAHGKVQMPNSLNDILKPRTGGTDANGNPERMFLPTPVGMLAGFMQHPVDSIGNRIANVWKTAYHEFVGSDEKNVELSGAENRLKYAAKSLSPYSVQNALSEQKPGRPSSFLRSAVQSAGMHFSYPSESKAEEEIYSHMQHDVRTPEEAEKSELVNNFAARMRKDDPKVDDEINKAIDAGKLNNNDYKTIVKRSQGTSKLAGLLNSEEMHKHPERYASVWDKMTPSEKSDHADQIYKIVSRSKVMDPDKRDALLEKINKDTTRMAGVQ